MMTFIVTDEQTRNAVLRIMWSVPDVRHSLSQMIKHTMQF